MQAKLVRALQAAVRIAAGLLWVLCSIGAAGVSSAGELWQVSVTVSENSTVQGGGSWSFTTPVTPSELIPVTSVTISQEGTRNGSTSGRAFISAVLENGGMEGEVFLNTEDGYLSLSVGGSISDNSLMRTVETVNGILSAGHESVINLHIPLREGNIIFQDTPDYRGIAVGAYGTGKVNDRRRRVERGEWRDLPSYDHDRDRGTGIGCSEGDPGFGMSRTGGGYTVSCREQESSTQTSPDFGEVTTVTVKTMTAIIRPAGKLKADAGGPYRVERGGRVTLDGTNSTGAIRDWTWRLRPSGDCSAGPDAGRAELRGGAVEVVLLCPVSITLTVTDGRSSDSDTAVAEVIPREWETPIEHVAAEGTLDPSLPPIADPWLMKFNGGANTCSVDGDSTDDNHILHPAAAGLTWEGAGYGLRLVEDPGGPFDGFWFVDDYRLKVTRVTQMNKYIIPGGPPPLSGLISFYDKNKAEGTDVVGYLAAVRDHEREHSRRFERWLSSNDPARELEKAAGRDREALKKEIDERLERTESETCKAGQDPLPVTWTGILWFGEISGAGWVKGETDVGGTYQKDLSCP